MKIFALIKFYYALIAMIIQSIVTVLFLQFLPNIQGVKVSAWLMLHSIFLKIVVEGEEEDENVQMFLLNHESDIDIPLLESITQKKPAWVAKKELFDMFFFGHMLKFPNNIPIERESKTSLIKLLKDCKNRLDNNRVITIFPEGTRSTKKKMLPFKSGAKIVADKYKLRVQPIVIINSSSYFSTKLKHYSPGCVKIVRLKSFTAEKSDKEWLNRCREEMQEVYDRELAKMPTYRKSC